MGVGARATALGGAFSSALDGASSVYWNPAHSPWYDGRALAFNHWFLGLDRSLSYVGYTQPLPKGGGIGLAWVGAATSDIDGRDSDGRPTETYTDQRHAFYFSFGFRPHRIVSVGISLKPYYRRVAEQTASGAGFDIGVLVRPREDVSVALVGYELGITQPAGRPTGAYWSWNTRDYWGSGFSGVPQEISRSDRFLKRLRIGVSCQLERYLAMFTSRLEGTNAQAFLDVEKVEMFDADVLAGLEVEVTEGLAVRVGRGIYGAVAGLGVNEGLPWAGMRLDYAFTRLDLSDRYTHQVQVSFQG
jgi:hypothetical protein